MSAYDTFAADSLRREVWLWELYPRDANGDEVTLRYGTETWVTNASDTPASTIYRGRVAQAMEFGVDQFPPRASSRQATKPGGELRLLQQDGDLDTYGTDAYLWDGATARCLHGGYSPALGRRLQVSEFATLWEGLCEAFEPATADAIVRLRPRQAFESPLEARRHRGNSWCLDMGAATYIGFGAGAPTKVDLRGSLSMDFVIYLDSAGMGTIRRLVGWDHGATTYPFQVRINASNQLVFRESSGTIVVTSTFTFSAGRRYWVGITIGSGTLRLYKMDLVTMIPTREDYTVSASTRPAPDGSFRIGHASAGHDGLIECVRIWDQAKTVAAMRQLRLRPLTTTELADTHLKLAILLDDGSGTTCVDSAPSAANGTITGTYNWYSSLEGGPDLAGKPKVNAFGYPQHMEPRYVGLSGGSLQPTYQIHADAIDNGKLVVMEGGVSGPTLNTAYTDLKLFLAGTTPSSKFDALRSSAGSFIRVNTLPTLPLGARFDGDAADGTYRLSVADLVQYLATTRGDSPLSGSDIDTSAWSALDAAAGGDSGIVITEAATVGQVISQLLAGVGANAWTNRAGLLTVDRLSEPAGTADYVLDERDILELRPLPLPVPASRVTVNFKRNFLKLPTDRVSASATAAQRVYTTSEWATTSRRDFTVADLHPQSEELIVESYLIDASNAQDEAERLLGLHGVTRTSWECISRVRFPNLEPFATIELRLSLLAVDGTGLDRLNFPKRFRVLGWSVSGVDGRMSLILWG